MVTLADAILAINPKAQFEYDDIDNIIWKKKTKRIDKDTILAKYRELKDIELLKAQEAADNQPSELDIIINYLDSKKYLLFKFRQAIATSSIVISLAFTLNDNFHKVRYTILSDDDGTEFVYDRFTGKVKKKIKY